MLPFPITMLLDVAEDAPPPASVPTKVLLLPVVTFCPAPAPMATLDDPEVNALNTLCPTAVLALLVTFCSASNPIPVLLVAPAAARFNAPSPTPVFPVPVVVNVNTAGPIPTLLNPVVKDPKVKGPPTVKLLSV